MLTCRSAKLTAAVLLCVLPYWNGLGLANTVVVPAAASTIQDAIDLARPGDTVLVADGIYTGDGNRDIDFGGKALCLLSINGPEVTIIDAQAAFHDEHRGFFFHRSEDSTAVVDGFTVRGGFAPTQYGAALSNGGGILCDSGSAPVIRNCIITGNSALEGGAGVACMHASAATFEKCTIRGNPSSMGSPRFGGGIRCQNSNARFIDCAIEVNRAEIGGGAFIAWSDLTMRNCMIGGNLSIGAYSADSKISAGIAGGLYIANASPQIEFSVIQKNIAYKLGRPPNYSGGVGGGLVLIDANPVLENCTIRDNEAMADSTIAFGEGAAILSLGSYATITRCLVTGNRGASAYYIADSTYVPDITCSDIFGNENGDWTGILASLLMVFGNISADPLYCPDDSLDWSVRRDSPCLPDNNICSELIGAEGQGCVDTKVNETSPPMPDGVTLQTGYPNPFNAATQVEYVLDHPAEVELAVYDILGRRVETLEKGLQSAGWHRVSWNAGDRASGVYFIVLEASGSRQVRKGLLLK